MDNEPIKVYPARWLMLAVFGIMASLTQVLWLSFAPITGPAAAFYGKSDFMIGLLSMVFMIVYIVLAIPAAWAIDTWGFKAAAGLGAVLSAVFALMRGLFASNYTIVLRGPDRDRRRPAPRDRRHHQGRGPLVPRPGAGDGLGAGDAGALRGSPGRHAPLALSLPAVGDEGDAPDLRRGHGRQRRCCSWPSPASIRRRRPARTSGS